MELQKYQPPKWEERRAHVQDSQSNKFSFFTILFMSSFLKYKQ
jgi:hypothetical protein